MTISTTDSKRIYDSNGVTVTWSYAFKADDASTVKVFLTDAAGNTTEQFGNFTVDLVGKSVRYPSVASGLPPIATGCKIVVARKVELTQELDLQNQGPFDAEELEKAYDKLTMIAQQHDEELSRCIQVPIDQTGGTDTTTYIDQLETIKNEAQAQADISTTQAGIATTQAGNASTEAANAATSAAGAAAAATAAVTASYPTAVANGGTGMTTLQAAIDKMSPTTTKGDIEVNDGVHLVRQPIGSFGTVFTADPSSPTGGTYRPAATGSNLITYADAETGDTSGWTECQISALSNGFPTAAATLTDGANGVWGIESVNPLSGQKCYKFTPKASGAGKAVRQLVTVPREYRGQVVSFQFPFEVVGSGMATGDISVAFRVVGGVSDGQWVQSTPFQIPAAIGNSKTSPMQLQLASDCTGVQIVIYQAVANCAFTQLNTDSFVFGAVPRVLGSLITDWQSYTPTFTGFGTPTGVEFQWRRVGSNVEIQGKFFSGTSTAVEGRASLPAGLTSASAPVIPSIICVGVCAENWNGALSFGTYVLLEPSVGYLTFGFQASNSNSLTKVNASTLLGAGQGLSFHATLPVAGWSSSTVSSADYGMRQAVASYKGLSTGALTSGSALLFNTLISDTTASYNPATGVWTAPFSGMVFLNVSGLYASTGGASINVFKNGSVYNSYFMGANNSGVGSGAMVVPVNAGDTLSVVSGTSGVTVNTAGPTPTLSIFILSSPQQVMATETVACRYYASVAQTPGVLSPVNFDSREYDNHSMVSVGVDWRATVPIAGKYRISASVIISSLSTTYKIFKNGLFYYNLMSANATALVVCGSTTIDCKAGDYLSLYSQSSVTLVNNYAWNWICIERIG